MSINSAVDWAHLVSQSAPPTRPADEPANRLSAIQDALCNLVHDLGSPTTVSHRDAATAMQMALNPRGGPNTESPLYPFHVDFRSPIVWENRGAFTGSYFNGTSVTYLMECELDERLHVLEIGEHKGEVDVLATTFPTLGGAVDAAKALFVASRHIVG